MENRKFVKVLSLVFIFLFIPVLTFAYSEETTHPALTNEIVKPLYD